MRSANRSRTYAGIVGQSSWSQDNPLESRSFDEIFVGFVFPLHVRSYSLAHAIGDGNVFLGLHMMQ